MASSSSCFLSQDEIEPSSSSSRELPVVKGPESGVRARGLLRGRSGVRGGEGGGGVLLQAL